MVRLVKVEKHSLNPHASFSFRQPLPPSSPFPFTRASALFPAPPRPFPRRDMREFAESGLAESIAAKSDGWRAVFAGDINVRPGRKPSPSFPSPSLRRPRRVDRPSRLPKPAHFPPYTHLCPTILQAVMNCYPGKEDVYETGRFGENVFLVAVSLNTPQSATIAKYLAK